jgi:hypothetical protein
MDGLPRTIRPRIEKGPLCLYIPKGDSRDLTEAERVVCLDEFSRWLDGRELHQANADEARALRVAPVPLLLREYMIVNRKRHLKGRAHRRANNFRAETQR